MKQLQGSGGPSFCWQCGLQLMRAPGKGKGLLYFSLIEDKDGVQHRVHGDCIPSAKEDGHKLVKPN